MTRTARSARSTCSVSSFATELGYTNLLNALDLAGIPLDAVDRDETHPIVVAGGHAAFNPEPIADFIDVAVLGDGEQAVLEITGHRARVQGRGQPGRAQRAAVPTRADRRGLRPAVLRRRVPRRRTHPARRPEPRRRAVAGEQAHRHGPRRVAVPEDAARAAGRERARARQRRDLPRLHARLPVLPGRHDHASRARAQHHRHRRDGRAVAAGDRFRRGRACSVLSSADHSEIADVAKGLADRYEGTNTSLSLPSTRVDAFNIDLANELTRNGRRSGLTFAPEGGSERIRKVINKMVTEDDLIRTVAAAYGNGWRQVKLYFMCGLPDRDRRRRPADRPAGTRGHQDRTQGRRPPRHPLHGVDRWVRAQAAHTVPVGRAARPRDHRCAAGQAARCDPRRPRVRQGDRLPLPRWQAGHRRRSAVARRPPGRQGDPRGLGGRRTVRRLERALQLRPVDAVRRRGVGGRAGRRRLVHHARARVRRGAALGPPRQRSRQGLAVGGLAGRAQRGRGRRLPMDAVLRLRRLPADGHRDRDRPDRQDACCRSPCSVGAGAAERAAAA